VSFLGALGGTQSSGVVGGALIRIGATASGLKQQVRGAVNDVKGELRTGTQSIEREASRWDKAFKLGFAALAGGGVAAAGIATWATKVAMDYETAFAGVKKTVDATDAQLQELSDGFRAMSREIPVSASELASLGEAAGALGVPIESIKEFARVTALLGVTTNVSSQDAATALGTLSNVLKLTRDDYAKFASTLVDLGNKGASTESQIIQIAERSGGGAALINMSAKATLAFASSVASLGVEVEAGGSSLQTFYLGINKMVASGAQLTKMAREVGLTTGKFLDVISKGGPPLDKLAGRLGTTADALRGMVDSSAKYRGLLDLLGMTGEQFQKLFRSDPAKGLYKIIEAIGTLDAGARQTFLAGLGFNDIRITRTLLGLTGNVKLLKDNLDNADAAWERNNALQNEATKRFETTQSRIQILQNRMTDLGITLGSMILPGLAEFVSFLADNLPKAVQAVGEIFDRTLGPALGRMAGGLGKLAGAVGSILFDWSHLFGGDTPGKVNETTSALEGVLNVFAGIAGAIGDAAGALGDLLSNPVLAGMAKLAVLAGTIAAAFTASKAAVGLLRGASGSLIRMLTLGRFGGTPQLSPADQAQQRAAQEQNVAAAKQQAAADTMMAAARGVATGGFQGFGPPTGPSSPFGQQLGPGGLDAAGRAALAKEARAAQLAGRNLIGRTAGQLADGLRAGVPAVKGLLSRGLGLVSKAFWPLAIAEIGLTLAQGPVGDLVSNNTQFKRAGAKIRDDFVGGMVDLVRSIAAGTDEWVGHAETVQVGKSRISTLTVAKMGFDSATIDKLETPTIENRGLVVGEQVATLLAGQIRRLSGETLQEWYTRVREALRNAGVDTSELDAIAKAGHGSGFGPEFERKLSAAVNKAGARVVIDAQNATREAVRAAIADFGRGQGLTFDQGRVMTLSAAQNSQIAEGLAAYLTGGLDPALLTGLINRTLKQSPIGTGITPTTGAGGPDESTKAANVGRVMDRRYDVKVALDLNRQTLKLAQQAYQEWLKGLTPEQETARQLSQQFLDKWGSAISGAKDEKARKALLAKINSWLNLTGSQKLSWDQLIDLTGAAKESSGAALTANIKKLTETSALLAARAGAPGAAAEFAKTWGDQFSTAIGGKGEAGQKARAALLRSINSSLPKESQFKSWTALKTWYLKQIDAATVDQEDELIDKLNLISRVVGGFELPKVKPPGMSAADWKTLQKLVEDGLTVNVDGTITRHKVPATKKPKVTPPSAQDTRDGLKTGVTDPIHKYTPPPIKAPKMTTPNTEGNRDKWYSAGSKLGGQLVAGAQVGLAPLGALFGAIAALLPHGSPAEKGPWKNVAWNQTYKAGQNIAGQLIAGYRDQLASATGGFGQAPDFATAGVAASGRPFGDQHINVDRLQLLTQADDRSVLRRLRFMKGA